MAKKENAKNKKKFPFAALRKGALFALLGATALTGSLLVGCDEGKVAGPTGVNFHYGAEDPTEELNGKVGDFYIETDDGDIWQLGENGWKVISNIKGPSGAPGAPGAPGETVTVEIVDGNWVIGGVDSGVKAEGVDGEDGDSAFELAIGEGFEGSVAEWLESLKGDQGYYVTSVKEVVDDAWGISSHYEFTLNDEAGTVISTKSVSRLMPNYYYGATTGAEFIELIELGAENIQLEKDIDVTEAIKIESNLSVDLNNHKLKYSNGTQIVIDNAIEVEFKDGSMDFVAKTCTTSSLKVQGGASLILDRVEYVSTGTNVMVIENATSVKVVDSHLTGAVYCVGTNALTEKNFGVKIEIDDCEFDTTGYDYLDKTWFDTTPVLINIPCTATIKDSKITGHRQAVVVRGGDVTIENCTLISTGKDLVQGLGLEYNVSAWGTGNAVPMATLVAGNDGSSIYAKYATNLNLINTEIISQKMSKGIPTIHVAGGNAGDFGVTVNFEAEKLEESFMYGLDMKGENFVINVATADYEILSAIAMIASEAQGKIMPRLTQDVLAYGPEITLEEKMKVDYVREMLNQLGVLTEFDVWTMFDEENVCVETLEGLMYATMPKAEGGLELDFSQITLKYDIYVEPQTQEPQPIEALLEVEKINNAINQDGRRLVMNHVDTNNALVFTEEGLLAAVNTYHSQRITLYDNITFEGIGLVVGQGVNVTIDLNGYTVSAPNDVAGDGVFHVTSGGRLTIEDSQGTGVVDGECVSEYKMAVWADGGEVTINGGTFTNSSTEGTETQYDLIYASNGGRITINNGKFDCKTPRWTLNVRNEHKDYTFITVNGGEFLNYDPSASTTDENKDNNPPTDFTYGKQVETRKEDTNTWYIVVNQNQGE